MYATLLHMASHRCHGWMGVQKLQMPTIKRDCSVSIEPQCPEGEQKYFLF